MSDNLLSLISKLAYRIANDDPYSKNLDFYRRDDKLVERFFKRLRRKGCDALLGKSTEPLPPDPCVTDYGGNWSPATLITDYGREMLEHGAEKFNEIIQNSVNILLENEYDCVNDLFKFLLLLKKPLSDSSLNTFNDSCSESDIFSNQTISNSVSVLPEDSIGCSSEAYSRLFSSRALKYEENWTRQFDTKFQFLAEYSKKNLLIPDVVSLESLFSAKPTINTCRSQSNSFVFTEFIAKKNYHSEKNLFNPRGSDCLNDTNLLDSFVDSPIGHQLPTLSFTQNPWSGSGFTAKTSIVESNINSILSEIESKNLLKKSDNCSSTLIKPKDFNPVGSLIELKRTSNYCHSFSILYERVKENEELTSDDSFLFVQDRTRLLKGKSISSQRDNSKQIILGLWEQEQLLIKEFRPELAKNFPNLRMISMGDFVEDVKYLLTGINSGTFQIDRKTNCFTMHYGTCLEDVTPESLFHFSEEFIEAGNCYHKLTSYAVEVCKNNFDTCTTISQAFWKSIFDYLELHYTIVLEIPRTINLMSLKTCLREIREMIVTVAEICKVLKPDDSLPEGGELLTYLINIAEKINNHCVKNVVFGILQNCCSVYFMCILQTWMFKGHLENQNNELFIDWKRQKIKIKSRSYYNSFYVVDERIPVFLRDFEENIFNCGKSIHFLKLFNPEDKFIQILEKGEYPKMRPCLNVEELRKLENDFQEYMTKVIETCGQSVSIKTLRDEEKEKEKIYLEYVKEFKKLQEKQMEALRQRKLEHLKAEKDMKNKMLNEAWNLIETEKERKKLEIEEEKKRFNEEMKAAEEMEHKRTEEAKDSLKKYYNELLDVVEKKVKIADVKKAIFLKIIETPSSKNVEIVKTDELLDAINDNEVGATIKEVDLEGNVTATLDVNLNEKLNTEEQTKEEETKFDENLNPSSNQSRGLTFSSNSNLKGEYDKQSEQPSINNNSVTKEETVPHKCHSYRTLAAEEAEKNKCKIMKSEFGLGRINEEKEIKLKSTESRELSELEKNRRKVLELEYQILKGDSRLKMKAVESQWDITEKKEVASTTHSEKRFAKSQVKLQTVEEQETEEEPNFRDSIFDFSGVELKRKFECTDLGNPPEEKSVESKKVESNSLTSIRSQKDVLSEENLETNKGSEVGESCISMIKDEYINSLARDAAVFFHKLSPNDIICGIEQKNSYVPCTDFIQFQRFLRKSALIPLRIQEKLANDALLSHLLKGENLLSHLKSLRSYFFLNDGEFGRSFTHNTFRSLAKCTEPKQFFERSNLSNIVNEALNYTIHNSEPNSQNLSFQIVKMPPFLNHSFHDVLSPFELSYKVDWPLNIILTEKVLSKYKIVFKFLLKLKRINWTMNENFLFLNSYVKNKNVDSKALIRSPHYHKIQIYRHAITEIMITLDDYIFSSGIQFPWIFFLKDLETTENIDDLYQKHVTYIKDVLTRCFLSKSSEDLLDCIHNLIEIALKFHYTTKSSIFTEVNGKYVHPKFEVLKTTFYEFCSTIKRFLGILKEKIGTNEVLRLHYVLVEKFDLKLT